MFILSLCFSSETNGRAVGIIGRLRLMNLGEVQIRRNFRDDMALSDDSGKKLLDSLFVILFDLCLKVELVAVAAARGSLAFFESILPFESTITTSDTSIPSTAFATRFPIP